MAEKRRNKPIQIALTEEQIANIIQEAASQSRDLNVESLEDRIAPSRFGLPVLGGAEDLVENPEGPEGPQVGEDGTTLDDPLPEDPNAPQDPFDPTLGEGGGDGTTIDPHQPGGALDPNALDPNDPALNDPFGQGGDPFDPAAGGSNSPWTPGSPEYVNNLIESGLFDGSEGFFDENGGLIATGGGLDANELHQVWNEKAQDFIENLPDDLDQELRDQIINDLGEFNDYIGDTIIQTGEMPPPDQLAEHRQQILENLRVAQDDAAIEAENNS